MKEELNDREFFKKTCPRAFLYTESELDGLLKKPIIKEVLARERIRREKCEYCKTGPRPMGNCPNCGAEKRYKTNIKNI